jgi:hypothetical protein
MIIEIPPEVKKELQWVTIEDLNNIIDTAFTTSNHTLLIWSLYSKAEYLLSLDSPNDVIEALQLYKTLISWPDDISKQIGMLGLAGFFLMEREGHPANLSAAYELYDHVSNMTNLPYNLRQISSFGKAECQRLATQSSISTLLNKFSSIRVTKATSSSSGNDSLTQGTPVRFGK